MEPEKEGRLYIRIQIPRRPGSQLNRPWPCYVILYRRFFYFVFSRSPVRRVAGYPLSPSPRCVSQYNDYACFPRWPGPTVLNMRVKNLRECRTEVIYNILKVGLWRGMSVFWHTYFESKGSDWIWRHWETLLHIRFRQPVEYTDFLNSNVFILWDIFGSFLRFLTPMLTLLTRHPGI